ADLALAGRGLAAAGAGASKANGLSASGADLGAGCRAGCAAGFGRAWKTCWQCLHRTGRSTQSAGTRNVFWQCGHLSCTTSAIGAPPRHGQSAVLDGILVYAVLQVPRQFPQSSAPKSMQRTS